MTSTAVHCEMVVFKRTCDGWQPAANVSYSVNAARSVAVALGVTLGVGVHDEDGVTMLEFRHATETP